MYPRMLKKMRERVRLRNYVMTFHAEEEIDADRLSIFDVESAVLTGRIVERQIDQATGEPKFLVIGRSVERGESVAVVAKLGPTGKLVILTVYLS